MRITDEQLMAYADGELDAAAAAEVEAAIAADPRLAEAVARHRALRRQLRDAFAPALDEPVPEHLMARVRAPAAPMADVVPLRPRRRWGLPEWAAMAASLALGVALSQGVLRPEPPVLAPATDGSLKAQGVLAQALDRQLAAEAAPQDRVVVGISFRDREGGYCRSFLLRDGQALAGLACRSEAGWRVPVLSEVPGAETGGLRQAAAALPEAVLRAMDTRIAGDALDADGERRARDAGWR